MAAGSARGDGGTPAVIAADAGVPRPWTPPSSGDPGDARAWRLHAIALELCAQPDPEEILERALAEAVELSGADGGSAWMTEDGSVLRRALACGDDVPPSAGSSVPLSNVAHLEEGTVGSIVAVAIRVDGVTRAALRVRRDPAADHPFDDTDRAFVSALADVAGMALEIGDHLRTATTRTRSFALVAEMSREITSTLDLDRVLRAVVNLAARALTFDRGALALYEQGECDIRAVAGMDEVDRGDPKLKDLAVRAAWAAGVRQSFYLSDRTDPGTDAERIFAQLFGSDLDADAVKSGIYLPLMDEEGVVGILLFESSVTEFADAHQRELAEILANQATVAIRNAHLYSQVPLHDVLGAIGAKKRALLAVPRRRMLLIAAGVVVLLTALTLVRWPLRVTGTHPVFRAAHQSWVRPLVSGVVERVLVGEGSVVQRGDALLSLRTSELSAARDAAVNAASAAERAAAVAASRGDAGAEQVERLRAASSRQEASILEEELRAAVVRAPLAGVVLSPRPEERIGSHVEAGEPLMLIGRTDTLELELAVGQKDLGRVHPGDPVRIRIDALPQRTFDGSVVSVAALPVDSAGAVGFPVRALVPNDEGLLRPGMKPYARILTAPASVLGRAVRAPAREVRILWWKMWG